jgi:hypothetical protein
VRVVPFEMLRFPSDEDEADERLAADGAGGGEDGTGAAQPTSQAQSRAMANVFIVT